MNTSNSHIKQSFFWLIFIIIIILWLRLDINYNSASPLENTYLGVGSTLLSGNHLAQNISNIDNLSTNFPALFIGLGQIIDGYSGGRMISIIFSIITFFFFYKFSILLIKDKFAVFISIIFFSIQAPFIFISKQATNDIIALCFFSGFLWIAVKIISETERTKIITIIFLALLLFLATISNYLLLIYFIPLIILLFLRSKNTFFYFLISFAIIFFISILLFNINPISGFYYIFINKIQSASFAKIIIRIAEYLAIPYMIFIAAIQYRWKTELNKTIINLLLSMSLIIPLYLVFNRDSFAIWRTISISLLFISPIVGFVISKFLAIEGQYKYASIFLFFFIALMSIWQVNKLEESYPNTKSITKYMAEYIKNENSFYSDDPFLPLNNLNQIESLKDIYLPTPLTKNLTKEEKDEIIGNIQSAKFDYVIINGLCDASFYYKLKKSILSHYYDKIFISEFTCTKSMYENNDGEYLIYKLKSYYRSLRKSFADSQNKLK